MAVVGDAAVVLGGEHGVVDDQVGALAQAHHAGAHRPQRLAIGGGQLAAGGRGAGDELVAEQDVGEGRGVADVGHLGAVGHDGVGGGDVGVIEAGAGDLGVLHLELGIVGQLVEVDGGPGLLERDREVGGARLAGHDRLQGPVGALAGIDVQLVALAIQGGEERQPLDVIPVGVADQQVGGAGARFEFGLHQLLAQAAQAGAGVDDQAGTFAGDHLHAAGVAAVAFGAWPGHGQRAAHAPEAHSHGQNPRACRSTMIRIYHRPGDYRECAGRRVSGPLKLLDQREVGLAVVGDVQDVEFLLRQPHAAKAVGAVAAGFTFDQVGGPPAPP